ncbi:CvpA family protein [Roseospira goensis]|uniref:Membrane protein required for colicin V production n=1 Tax=Roseospira goensis TaxID=391922 RepID=A0A7W6WMI7_9PROT|nr:CvpA family protein [Roseospira goensis]MBB4287803.1 membrane protein required for colicin V production [Roseospira goensis]
MENWPVNPVDIVVLVILVVSAALAFFRGFVHEVLAIAAWIGAVLAAIYGLPHAQPYARQYIPIDWVADLAAAVAIFLATLVVLSVVTTLIARRVQDSALNTLDRSLGFLFGLARGAVVIVVLYVAAAWLVPPDTQPPWVQQARSMPVIVEGAETLVALLPEDLLTDGQALATQAGDGAARAMEAQRAFEQLRQPEPGAEATPRDPGYDAGERQDMDRLIESTQ